LEGMLRRTGVIPDSVCLREKLAEPQNKNKGGRPVEHNWPEARVALIEETEHAGPFLNRAAAAYWMSNWFQRKHRREPAASAVKKFINNLIKELGPTKIIKKKQRPET
jgi:hypothetical protein